MIITNKYNLPETIINAIGENWKPKENRFSVTDLTSPPQIRYLKIKHWDKLEEDASERLWALLGNAVHYVLYKGSPDDSFSEEKMEVPIEGGITIVGKSDLWHNGEVSDYKITSVYSFLLGDKPEWEATLNLYAWLFLRMGLEVKKLTINAILRDWQKSKLLTDKDYPPIPFQSVNVKIWNEEKLKEFIQKAITDLTAINPRECSNLEQWARPTTFAVMKEDNKKALRVLNTFEEAEKWLIIADNNKSNKNKLEIVERKGQKIRCESYCPVKEVCEQRKRESIIHITQN